MEKIVDFSMQAAAAVGRVAAESTLTHPIYDHEEIIVNVYLVCGGRNIYTGRSATHIPQTSWTQMVH